MTDFFSHRVPGLESPASRAGGVTPDDLADLAVHSRALYIGQTGDLRVTLTGGDSVTLPNVPSGVLPLRVRRVHATGTTAAGIVALW